MIWDTIRRNHRLSIVLLEGALTGARYRREFLKEVAIPFSDASVGEIFIFQDNDRAALVEEFHEEQMDYFYIS